MGDVESVPTVAEQAGSKSANIKWGRAKGYDFEHAWVSTKLFRWVRFRLCSRPGGEFEHDIIEGTGTKRCPECVALADAADCPRG